MAPVGWVLLDNCILRPRAGPHRQSVRRLQVPRLRLESRHHRPTTSDKNQLVWVGRTKPRKASTSCTGLHSLKSIPCAKMSLFLPQIRRSVSEIVCSESNN